MTSTILTTKLFVPLPKAETVLRPRLVQRLEDGSRRKLTLLSASAGFGKTTLLSQWISSSGRKTAWLSLDEEHREPARFLLYLVAALRTVVPQVGEGVLAGLQSPFPPGPETMLASLINEIADCPRDFSLVLDDYHRLDSPAVDLILGFLVDHLPPPMHMILSTREDPSLALPRLRARGELTEIRMADLRFNSGEAMDFLNRGMGLNLSAEAGGRLAQRTEGWITGLQLAALSLTGNEDPLGFIDSFAGSHRFVLDYLIEEVLKGQPPAVQEFLFATSILGRLCGPLCDAVLDRHDSEEMLARLEQSNLFIVALDHERRWYRYHQLFAEMLGQRLHQHGDAAALHRRACLWLEANGWEPEAFRHAAAAHDVDAAERLIEGGKIPLHDRGAVADIRDWLATLPAQVLDQRPVLWLRRATVLLLAGQTTGVEDNLTAAEAALAGRELDGRTRDLVGQIAVARATVAVTRYQAAVIEEQAARALAHLHNANLPYRFLALSSLGFAHQLQGDRSKATQSFTEALAVSKLSGDSFSAVTAATNLGQIQELENQLPSAATHYRSVMRLYGEHPQPYACEAALGLARIHYQWNEAEAAERYGRQSLALALQYDQAIDRFVLCELFLARLAWSRGDGAGAGFQLAQTSHAVRERGFLHRLPELAALEVLVLLGQGEVQAAGALADEYRLTASQARVGLAKGEAAAALALLEKMSQESQRRQWADDGLRTLVLQALAYQQLGDRNAALKVMAQTLTEAEPGGFVRLFVDEGEPMRELLAQAAASGIKPTFVARLLGSFPVRTEAASSSPPPELLSLREREVLELIARGLSNHDIGAKLFLALDTVKGHNRRIFEKLQVERRTEAVARARELGLL